MERPFKFHGIATAGNSGRVMMGSRYWEHRVNVTVVAPDAFTAKKKIKRALPDYLSWDIEWTRMDEITEEEK